MPIHKLGAISLIIGIPMALIFFLFQPGGILIDRVDPADTMGAITAFASNTGMTNLTALAISLGLVLALYGFYILQAEIRDNRADDALSRFGLAFLVLGIFGWITTQGLTLVMADTQLGDPASLAVAEAVYAVESGITQISTLAVALGFLAYSLGLETRRDFNKIISAVVVIASLVVAVSLIIGICIPDLMSLMLQITRACYFIWAIWSVILGIHVLREEHPSAV